MMITSRTSFSVMFLQTLRNSSFCIKRIRSAEASSSGDRGPAEVELPVPCLGSIVEPVGLVAARPQEVRDLVAASREQLGDQAPVAPSPVGLRAHEAGHRPPDLGGERCLPPLAPHAGCVAAERGDANACELFLARLATQPPAQLDRVPIADRSLTESVAKSCSVELGIAPRAGVPPDVDECLHARLAQGLDELVEGSDSVAD